jgi:hypothetical protein
MLKKRKKILKMSTKLSTTICKCLIETNVFKWSLILKKQVYREVLMHPVNLQSTVSNSVMLSKARANKTE